MRLSEKLEGVLNNLAALNSESKPTDLIHAAGKAVDLLRNHAEDLRQALRDSERWRFVRDNPRVQIVEAGGFYRAERGSGAYLTSEWHATKDAAIDAAMGRREGE